MNMVAVECPTCRLTEPVPASLLLIDLATPDADDETCTATVCWICVACVDLASVTIGWELMIALVAAGAAVLETDDVDPRPVHPESAVAGRPLTLDDVLDLHQRLESEGWFEELCCLDAPGVS